jgi:hypothetical protein
MQLSSFLMDYGMSLEEAFHQGRIDVSGSGAVTVDASLPAAVAQAIGQHLPVEVTRRAVFPYAFACPAACCGRQPERRLHGSDVALGRRGGGLRATGGSGMQAEGISAA